MAAIRSTVGRLDPALYGKSGSLQDDRFFRRTIYGRVSRADPSGYLRLYDFPDANQTNPGRDVTTTSLQQLFALNGSFMLRLAGALAQSVRQHETYAEKVPELYRRALGRDPTSEELAEGRAYLKQGSVERLAQILLSMSRTQRAKLPYAVDRHVKLAQESDRDYQAEGSKTGF